jgi:hypothetical protein
MSVLAAGNIHHGERMWAIDFAQAFPMLDEDRRSRATDKTTDRILYPLLNAFLLSRVLV